MPLNNLQPHLPTPHQDSHFDVSFRGDRLGSDRSHTSSQDTGSNREKHLNEAPCLCLSPDPCIPDDLAVTSLMVLPEIVYVLLKRWMSVTISTNKY